MSRSPEETLDLGISLALVLQGGETLALSGELGAGKTTLIRGLAQGLGVEDMDSVKSPSYTLVLHYPGQRPLLHLDAYFMESGEDLDLCGMHDALIRNEVVVVEWGDRVRQWLPKDTVFIQMTHVDPFSRRIRILT